MIQVPIDFAKIAALGDYVRYSEESIYMGSVLTREEYSFQRKLSSGWLNEVLGKEFGMQTFSNMPSTMTVETIYEVFGSDWTVLFKPRMRGLSWWGSEGEYDGAEFQTRYAEVSGAYRSGCVSWTDLVFCGNYESYERDMTLFFMVCERARQKNIKAAAHVSAKPEHLDQLFNGHYHPL